MTRNVPGRFHGFLASCMLEVAPGVYVAPRMKKSIRERVWETILEWDSLVPSDGGVVLFWKSRNAPSGLGVRLLGWPKKQLLDHEGVWLTVRNLTDAHDADELELLSDIEEHPATDDDLAGDHLPSAPETAHDDETRPDD
ncbi:MAG: type I-E CRISPR-associated endoribonuclease Cas2e [Bradymonadaceae bacterium]